jgi:hypothetical protein
MKTFDGPSVTADPRACKHRSQLSTMRKLTTNYSILLNMSHTCFWITGTQERKTTAGVAALLHQPLTQPWLFSYNIIHCAQGDNLWLWVKLAQSPNDSSLQVGNHRLKSLCIWLSLPHFMLMLINLPNVELTHITRQPQFKKWISLSY